MLRILVLAQNKEAASAAHQTLIQNGLQPQNFSIHQDSGVLNPGEIIEKIAKQSTKKIVLIGFPFGTINSIAMKATKELNIGANLKFFFIGERTEKEQKKQHKSLFCVSEVSFALQ